MTIIANIPTSRTMESISVIIFIPIADTRTFSTKRKIRPMSMFIAEVPRMYLKA